MKIQHYIFYLLLSTQVHSTEDLFDFDFDFDGATLWVPSNLFQDTFRAINSAYLDYNDHIEEENDSFQPSLKRTYQEKSADDCINFIQDQTPENNDQPDIVSEPPLKKPRLIESQSGSTEAALPQTSEIPIQMTTIPQQIVIPLIETHHTLLTPNNPLRQNNLQPPPPVVVLPPVQKTQENNAEKKIKKSRVNYRKLSVVQIAQEHHEGKGDMKTRLRYTGKLIVMLCQEQKNLDVSNFCSKKENLGNLFYALYLRGDAKLLWEKYLCIEDYEKFQQEQSYYGGYLSQIVADDKKQDEIKIAALKMSALLGNQLAIDEMNKLRLVLSANEQRNKRDFSYIVIWINEIMNMMNFVPMKKFKTQAVSNRKVNNVPRRKDQISTPSISTFSPTPSINNSFIFQKALEHHNGETNNKTKLHYTGCLVVELCQQVRDLNIFNLHNKKDHLGDLFAALYLRGDAGLLWEKYLCIEDYEKHFDKESSRFNAYYVSQKKANTKKQKEIKMAALKVSALLGNQFSIEKMNELNDLKLILTEDKNNGDYSYIVNRIKEIMNMMKFVPEDKIKCGIIPKSSHTIDNQQMAPYSADSHLILKIAQKHHRGEGKKRSRFLHTGKLVVELCKQHRNISTQEFFTNESINDLGNLFTALYLRGDVGLLWEKYLKIDDFERKYNENPAKVNLTYRSLIPAKSQTQEKIKMAALKVAALLDNQISIDTMQQLGIKLTDQELEMKTDYNFIFDLIKNVMDMMKFVKEGEIRCGI